MPVNKLEVSVSDLAKRPRVQITQGDRRSRVIEATVTDGGSPMDLTGKRARFRAELPLGKVVIDDGCEVADAEAGVIRYTVGDEVAARAAVISDAYFEIYDEEGYSLAASKMVVEVGRGVDVDGERPGDYVPELDRLKAELARIAEEAKSAESERASEFEAVKADAERATRAADEAAQKAEAAATKAENAAASAIASIGNVLVGEASGTLAHAEDAFAGAGIRRLTVEGACKQVTTTGKNLCAGFEYGQIDTSGTETGNGTTKSCRTGFIAVEGGCSYVLSLVGVSASSTAKGRQYDSEKAYIGSLALYAGKAATTAATCAYLRYEFDESVSGDTAKLVEGKAHAQIEKGSSATAYEPYTGGKPSPSPDYPQAITVIENPVVRVMGRNLANPSEAYYFAAQGLPKAEQIADGFRFTITNNDTRLIAVPFDVKKGDTVVVNFDAKKISGNASRIQIYFPKLNAYLQIGKPHVMEGDADFVGIYVEANTTGVFEVTNFRVSRNTDDGYAPYTSQSRTFTLPAEHPYLAKLPDGTADTIEVDQEGNVELVARVSKHVFKSCQIVSNSASQVGADGSMNYVIFLEETPDAKIANAAACVCSRFADGGTSKNSNTIRRGAGNACFYIYTADAAIIGDGTPQAVNEWLAANTTEIMYEVAEPTRYQLGKIDMPKAQDSIINVLTDAEVTPNTGISYVRDVNIVVSHLESAIASITEG